MTQPERTEMPVTDLYFELLQEARTQEDIAALVEMYAADEAARKGILTTSGNTLVALPDGSVEPQAVVLGFISNNHQRVGLYDGSGRRA